MIRYRNSPRLVNMYMPLSHFYSMRPKDLEGVLSDFIPLQLCILERFVFVSFHFY